MRKIVLVLALLLPTCYKFAGIDWQKELENTEWAEGPAERVSQFNMQGQGYTIWDNKLLTITRLNEEGLRIMEAQGCSGCHQDGGILPPIQAVIDYKERPVQKDKLK